MRILNKVSNTDANLLQNISEHWHHWPCFQWNFSQKTFLSPIFCISFLFFFLPSKQIFPIFVSSFTSSKYFIHSVHLWQHFITTTNYILPHSNSWSLQIKKKKLKSWISCISQTDPQPYLFILEILLILQSKILIPLIFLSIPIASHIYSVVRHCYWRFLRKKGPHLRFLKNRL